MITYRLHDALPPEVIAERREYAAETRQRIERALDVGYGSCLLHDPRLAQIVVDNWHHFDGERYRLLSWVVMPNHVHTLIEVHPGHPLSQIVQAWKSFTAKAISRIAGRQRVWQADYWDRAIRDERHYVRAVTYIEENPVKARLVVSAELWPWSSAHQRRF